MKQQILAAYRASLSFTSSRLQIFEFISLNGPSSQKQLCDQLDLNQSLVSRSLSTLRQANKVERIANSYPIAYDIKTGSPIDELLPIIHANKEDALNILSVIRKKTPIAIIHALMDGCTTFGTIKAHSEEYAPNLSKFFKDLAELGMIYRTSDKIVLSKAGETILEKINELFIV